MPFTALSFLLKISCCCRTWDLRQRAYGLDSDTFSPAEKFFLINHFLIFYARTVIVPLSYVSVLTRKCLALCEPGTAASRYPKEDL